MTVAAPPAPNIRSDEFDRDPWGAYEVLWGRHPVSAGNRDLRKCWEPDAYDIHRAGNDLGKAFTPAADHLAYVNGRHFCAGAVLARQGVEFGMNYILANMRDLRLADGFEPVESGLWTRSAAHLHVTFVNAD